MAQESKPTNPVRPMTASAPVSDPLVLARTVRQATAKARKAMSPKARFAADLTLATNRVANLIDGQRGHLLGIVSRGLADGSLDAKAAQASIAFIRASLDRVEAAVAKKESPKARFSLQ